MAEFGAAASSPDYPGWFSKLEPSLQNEIRGMISAEGVGVDFLWTFTRFVGRMMLKRAEQPCSAALRSCSAADVEKFFAELPLDSQPSGRTSRLDGCFAAGGDL